MEMEMDATIHPQEEVKVTMNPLELPEVPMTPLELPELSSCDFVGDLGCSDLDCWYCHSPVGPENLRALARHLATAAMLCRAWRLASTESAWFPGCCIEERAL
jgi:hypothetical protein